MHPTILFSSPRCEDAYIYCTLPNGIRVLFDTGTGNAALPRNLIQECQEAVMKMMPIPIDVTKGYIDGHKAH